MKYGVVDSLVRASIPAIVLGVFALARRYLPAKPAKRFGTAYSIEQLSQQFRITQWAVGAAMIAIGAIIAWGVHSILVNLSRLFVSLEGPADFVLLPQSAIWWFFPGFAAITLAWDATLGAWSFFGDRKEAVLYNYWTISKAGFDSTNVLRIMAVVIVFPIAILTLLAVPQHAVLRAGGIKVHGYGFKTPAVYRYSDARRTTIIDGFRSRGGKLTRRAGVVLDFSDGRRWSSADLGDFRRTIDPALVDYLQSRTGLDPQYAETQDDIR